ncbi:MAG: HAMP domain-containing protein, partial [Dehalococcoidia bacterium]
MKIKPKLTLAFLLAGLVPLVILGVFSYNNAKEGVSNGVLNQLQSVAVIQKHRVESIISQNLERLALVSSRTQLRISLDSYIRGPSAARSSIEGFEEIYVLNLDGEVVAATNETVTGSSFANEEAFIRGRAEENSGALLFLDETEELKNYLSGPLYLEDEFIGVVIIKSSADNIIAVLKDYAGLGSTGETLLAERNQEGNALFISPLRFDPQAELHRTMSIDNLDSPTVQALLGNEGLLTNAVDYRGEPVLAAVQYIPEVDWGLVTKIDQAEAFAPVALLHNLTVLTIGLAAALVVGVSLYLARSVSKPIQSQAHVTDKIREGDISQRAEVTSVDEVGMLAQHFNEMTEDLVKTNNTLRSTNRALKTLSECNQILVRSTDESTLLKGICRIIVTHGGYCGARVGLVDPDDKVAVRPVAEAWRQNGDCSNHNVAWPEDEGDHAMFMEAVKSDKPLILKDIHIDASCAHLCAEA